MTPVFGLMNEYSRIVLAKERERLTRNLGMYEGSLADARAQVADAEKDLARTRAQIAAIDADLAEVPS